MRGMTGNVREFDGIITAIDTHVVHVATGQTFLENPVLTFDVEGLGYIYGSWFTDDVDEARELLGRRVRATVEILDG